MTTYPEAVAGRSIFHTPERNYDQRMSALRHANDVRVKRARMKEDIGAGKIALVEILRDPPFYAATMKVYDLLMALPKYGHVKAKRVLIELRISESKTIVGMSDRQRHELIRRFTANGKK